MKLDIFALFQKKPQQAQPGTALPLPLTGEELPLNGRDETSGAMQSASPNYDGEKVFGGLQWYREQYQRSMKVNLILGGGLCLSFVVIGLLVMTRPTPLFFAATPDLRLAPLVPLSKPVLTQQGLLNWVTDTITNAVSLDFLEWRSKLTKTRENFSEAAFQSFLDSLKGSGIIDMIQQKRLSASAVVTQAPVIIASGVLEGRATWKIEFPIIISYESSQGVESTQKLMATVLVRRAPTVTTPRGVVVEQVVLKRDS